MSAFGGRADIPDARDHNKRTAFGYHGGRMCYGHSMRYHKAVEITQREADSIIATGGASLTDVVVISHGAKWFDVRSMTRAECEAFVADLARAEIAADGEEAKKSLPN